MEVKCHDLIKNAEQMTQGEMAAHDEQEKCIAQLRQTPNEDELYLKVLDKSITSKARDKMKQEAKKVEEEAGKDQANDFLAPILKKLHLQDQTSLNMDAALSVKNEALRSLKERLLTRAEIIQRRLEAESKALNDKFQEYRRKGDTFGQND